MKIFQRTLSYVLPESVSRLAGAKVRLFSEPPKLFEEKFQFSNTFFIVLDFSQSSANNTPSITYTRAIYLGSFI
jgi:hypothetical protein